MHWTLRQVLCCWCVVITLGCGAAPSQAAGARYGSKRRSHVTHQSRSDQPDDSEADADDDPDGSSIGDTERTALPNDGAEAFALLEQKSRSASVRRRFRGQASYYADSLSGNQMASGQRYDPAMPYAAHRTLPFGTLLRVTRDSNGHSVVVRVSDRGPFGSRHRVIDLSRAAAERLGMLRDGVADIHVEVLAFPH